MIKKTEDIRQDIKNYMNDVEANTDEQVVHFLLGYLSSQDDQVRILSNTALINIIKGATKSGRKITHELMHKVVVSILLNGNEDLINLVIEKYELVFKKIDSKKDIKLYQPYRVSYGSIVFLSKKYNVYNMAPFSSIIDKHIVSLNKQIPYFKKRYEESDKILQTASTIIISKMNDSKVSAAELRPYQSTTNSYKAILDQAMEGVKRLEKVKQSLIELEAKLKYKVDKEYEDELINPEDFKAKTDPMVAMLELAETVKKQQEELDKMKQANKS
jgi:hypothetical protein